MGVYGLDLSSALFEIAAFAAIAALFSFVGTSPISPNKGFAIQNWIVPNNIKTPAKPNPQCHPKFAAK
ncbi:hypothetical protein D3C80_1115740 [compost metagenome]